MTANEEEYEIERALDDDEVYEMLQEAEYASDTEEEQHPSSSSSSSSSSPQDFRMNEPPPSLMPHDDSTHRTGPKGVLDDFKASQRACVSIKMRARLQHEREIGRVTNGLISLKVTAAEEQSMFEHEKRTRKTRERRAAKQGESKQQESYRDDEEEEEEEEEEDEQDEAAFQAFARERLSAIKASESIFGTYDRVHTRAEFATIVNAMPDNGMCVCHVYDNSLEICARVHLSLEALSKQFTHVKFVRLRREDGFSAFPLTGLPALLLYQGKQLKHTALRIGEVLGRMFSDLDVARLLQAKGVLQQAAPLADLRTLYDKHENPTNALSTKSLVTKSRNPHAQLSDSDDDD